MSCFLGKLTEYPNISIDCFDKNNYDSDAYFLSHCHQDHMHGLVSTLFYNRLKNSSSAFIYCSEVTKNILLCHSKYSHLDSYLVGLPINHATNISINCGKVENLCVTLISAGHCIGSVMFLFEGDNGNVLYTGDFRLSKGSIGRMPVFKCGDSIKEITSIYVDSTFCLPQMTHIPTREETRDAVLILIKKWLQNSDNHYISLLCKGMYGYEYLLKEIAIALNTKIHISEGRLKLYQNLYDMKDYFTTNPEITKIHSCNWNHDGHSFSSLPCGFLLPAPSKINVLKIKPSSMWFARRKQPLPANCVVEISSNFCRVIHSMHSSMEEVIDLVSYLRPLNVIPTVGAAGLLTLKQTQESLECHTRDDQNVTTKVDEEQAKIVNKTMIEYQSSLCCNDSSLIEPSKEVLEECVNLGLINDIPNDKPRKRRRKTHETKTNIEQIRTDNIVPQ